MSEPKRSYRLPPCPDYDITGTQSWLEDMAAKGLILEKDGFFLGFLSFIKAEPQNLAYRLEAADTKGGIFADGNGEPADEAISLAHEMGWEYVARYKDFYIYRSGDNTAEELNTDPAVQALALKKVKSRCLDSLFHAIFWAVLYPAAYFLSRQPLTNVIDAGTWSVLLLILMVGWMLWESVAKYRTLSKLKRSLEAGEPATGYRDWKKGRFRHHLINALQLAVTVTVIISIAVSANDEIMEKDRIPLDEYGGEPPFATAADICPEAEYSIIRFMDISNYLKHWSDPLAPDNYRWREIAELTEEGDTKSLALDIDYHKAANPTIADIMAREYLRLAKKSEHYRELSPIATSAEHSVCFFEGYGYTSAILWDGNIVLQISVHPWQTDEAIDPIEVIESVGASVFPG